MFQLSGTSTLKNCLSCKLYLKCKDPLKSVIYQCDSYKRAKGDDGMLRLFDAAGAEMPSGLSVRSQVPDIALPGSLDGFDIYQTIKDAVGTNAIVSPDIKIPDGDFPLAKNFLDFCGPKFLNTKPYVSQALIGIRLFGEYCPRCSDVNYFDNYGVADTLTKLQKKICLLEHGVCPSCKLTKSKAITKGMLQAYNEVAISAGQRSGKSAMTGMFTAYQTHCLLKLQNPNEVYRLMKSNVLHGTFVALTYAQAKDTLWEPFYGNILESPWFGQYHSMLTDHHERTGEELYKLNDTFVLYRHRRMLIYPAGPDKRTLRGRTRIFGCITGDALVSTGSGLIRMDQPGLNGKTTNSRDTERRIVNHVYTGVRDVFRIKTKAGITVKATANHEFRVLSKDSTELVWKRLDQLTPGDVMAVSLGGSFPDRLDLTDAFSWEHPRTKTDSLFQWMANNEEGFTLEAAPKDEGKIKKKYASLTVPTQMTPSLAYILGYLVADGNYAMNGPEVTFTSTSLQKIRHYSACFEEVFGFAPRISSWTLESGRRAYNAVFALQPLKDFVEAVGLQRARSSKKVVPWSIMQAPRTSVAAFLSAAVSCDGSIAGDRLRYSSKSVKLVRQMQLLFLRLGYMCTTKKKGALAVLSMTSYDRDSFLVSDYTGKTKHTWQREAKAANLQGALSHLNYRVPGLKVQHPTRTWDEICVYSKSEFNHPELELSAFSSIIDRNMCFTPVTGIRHVGKEKVYDVTVDNEDREFTVNGFLAHNSIDELGWFDNSADSGKVKLSANEVYIALERSLLTVRAAATRLHKQGFTNAPTAYFYNVSSPSSARDKIMELVRKAQTSRNILGLIRPTWEMNPGVTRADLEDEFRKDPATAMRDYGAQPPLSSNAFLSEALVDGAIGEHKNAVVLNHQVKKNKKTGEMTRHAIISKVRRTGKASVLALDAGFVNNSFALALGHLKDHKFPMLDALIEVQAMPGIKINFSRVYRNVIEPLIEARNVKLVAADRWNSIKILSDLEEDHGVETRQYSLKYADMRLFKDYIEDKQIILPDPGRELSEIIKYDHHEYPAVFKNDPLGHFYLQMQTVQDTGSSVIKGDQLTDDMVRAAMLATRMLLDEDYQELFQQDQEEVRPFVDISKQAVYKGYSGGGGSSSPVAAGGQNALGVRKSRG